MDGGARAESGVMPTLVCLGLGYCARHYVREFGARFDRILGTTRNVERMAALGREAPRRPADRGDAFDGTSAPHELVEAIAQADALLISAAPAEGRDPVLAVLADEIERAPRLSSVVYLSTLGVYGDSGGAWIDESAETIPALARRGSARIDAERAWQALGARRNLPRGDPAAGRHLRSRTERHGAAPARHGASHRQAGHVSNRVHVYDIAQAIDAAFARRADGAFNIVDDEPASPSEQIAFAAQLIGIEPPPEIPYAEAAKVVTPFALSFYDGCIRARNDKLKAALGVTLRYPNYRDGLRALHAAGDHLAAPAPA